MPELITSRGARPGCSANDDELKAVWEATDDGGDYSRIVRLCLRSPVADGRKSTVYVGAKSTTKRSCLALSRGYQKTGGVRRNDYNRQV